MVTRTTRSVLMPLLLAVLPSCSAGTARAPEEAPLKTAEQLERCRPASLAASEDFVATDEVSYQESSRDFSRLRFFAMYSMRGMRRGCRETCRCSRPWHKRPTVILCASACRRRCQCPREPGAPQAS